MTATYKSKQFTPPEAAATETHAYTAPMIQGLVQLFIFQALGELVSKFALPFIPGPVLGLVLLLVFLSVRGHVPASIDLVGSSVLQHLGLLFIRVGGRGALLAAVASQCVGHQRRAGGECGGHGGGDGGLAQRVVEERADT